MHEKFQLTWKMKDKWRMCGVKRNIAKHVLMLPYVLGHKFHCQRLPLNQIFRQDPVQNVIRNY